MSDCSNSSAKRRSVLRRTAAPGCCASARWSTGDDELFDARVAQGFIGVALAEEHGGMDLGWPALVALIKEGGKALIEPFVLSAHQPSIEAVAARTAPRGQRLALSSAAARCYRLAERARRPDVFAPSVQATQGVDGWRLSGRATMVLGGLGASGYVVSAQCDDGLMCAGLIATQQARGAQADRPPQQRTAGVDEVLVADAGCRARRSCP